jgi:hypothetical protein
MHGTQYTRAHGQRKSLYFIDIHTTEKPNHPESSGRAVANSAEFAQNGGFHGFIAAFVYNSAAVSDVNTRNQ